MEKLPAAVLKGVGSRVALSILALFAAFPCVFAAFLYAGSHALPLWLGGLPLVPFGALAGVIWSGRSRPKWVLVLLLCAAAAAGVWMLFAR